MDLLLIVATIILFLIGLYLVTEEAYNAVPSFMFFCLSLFCFYWFQTIMNQPYDYKVSCEVKKETFEKIAVDDKNPDIQVITKSYKERIDVSVNSDVPATLFVGDYFIISYYGISSCDDVTFEMVTKGIQDFYHNKNITIDEQREEFYAKDKTESE